MVNDTGEADVVAPNARQLDLKDLPEDTLVFLMGSRYCETDLLSNAAWQLFGQTAPGWQRVQAICDFVHNHIVFGYENARPTKTAWEAFQERRGVCRDYAHLAVTLLPLHEYSSPLLRRLSGGHGHAAALRSHGFRRVVRSLPRRRLAHF